MAATADGRLRDIPPRESLFFERESGGLVIIAALIPQPPNASPERCPASHMALSLSGLFTKVDQYEYDQSGSGFLRY